MIVYWAVDQRSKDIPYINFLPPGKVLNESLKKHKDEKYTKCPAFMDVLKNTYSLKFPIDFDLNIEDNFMSSDTYNPSYFSTYILPRDYKTRLASLKFGYYFFCEEELEAEIKHPYFIKNDFVDKTTLIPGRMDIGKWFRPFECAFFVRDGVTNVNMPVGDVYAYLEFKTNEKIELKKFYMTDEFEAIVGNIVITRKYKSGFWPLKRYYDMFRDSKVKKHLIKLIKQNLLED